jgi:hypothetical protein
MAEIDVSELMSTQIANDVALQSRIFNSSFITTMSGSNAIHSRCGQVLDKRVSEFDVEENRAVTSIDPASQSFWLGKGGLDSGQVAANSALLVEILRQVQTK